MVESSYTRKFAYGLTSFLVGVWAFIKVNSISGPAFEPIMAACTNPDIAPDLFEASTGYHQYDRRVGLKAFDFLVCLITQFLLELRMTPPAGGLVWGGVMVVALPLSMINIIEGGRAGAKGPICYSVLLGLLAQLFGISVIIPMIWVPAFVYGEGKRGAPVTSYRINMSALLGLPAIVLAVIVFTKPTDSEIWTTSAGTLGGPLLALFNLLLFFDGSSKLPASKEAGEACSGLIKRNTKVMMFPGFAMWCIWVKYAYDSYGLSFGDLWKDVWVNAGPSVAFMTIDTLVLFLGELLFVAYRFGEIKAIKTLVLSIIVGPCVAVQKIMIEGENGMDFSHLDDETKKEKVEDKKDAEKKKDN